MSNQINLFYGNDLSSFLRGIQKKRAPEEVDTIPRDQFLNSSNTEIVESLYSELSVQPLEIFEDRKWMEGPFEIKMDASGDYNGMADDRPSNVPGTRVRVFFPFCGDPKLWKLQPDTFKSLLPRGQVSSRSGANSGALFLEMDLPSSQNQTQFVEYFDKQIELIHYCIKSQRGQIDRYHEEMRLLLTDLVAERRKRLEQQLDLPELLGIPLHLKDGASNMVPLEIRKKIVVSLPPAPKNGFKPEPGIPDEQYQEILRFIRHQCRTWETTPSTYQSLGEEDLRNIIISQLNGIYEGRAKGEVFRKSGRTDICIEENSRAAFIAECKLWAGGSSLAKALDQLLGYLTWRDCRTALVVFNKQVMSFEDIRNKTAEFLEEHPRFVSRQAIEEDGEWRCVFKSSEDENRLITVHIFLFNLYHKSAQKSS